MSNIREGVKNTQLKMVVTNIFQQGKVSKRGRVAGGPTVYFKLISSSCPITYFKLVLFVSIRKGDDKGGTVTALFICPRNSSTRLICTEVKTH